MKFNLFVPYVLFLVPAFVFCQSDPKPFGALPTRNHLAWHEVEQYVLVHFTPTTYQNKEWGFGDADPSIFNPVDFDAGSVVQAVKDGGFRGLILVAKHHDGFCLWPTQTTPYNITASPFRQGKGDMVKEFEVACRKAGVKFGIYCSPWDRNHPEYGRPTYVDVYHRQLTELYTQYGQLFMTWFDGANGGDGYYGGANEKRSIIAAEYYKWDKIHALVAKYQPTAVKFSDVDDVRWVGNEEGFAAETSWATFTPISPDGVAKPSPGVLDYTTSPTGTRGGIAWKPAECDVPLRRGWFYHPEQDGKSRTTADLIDLYFKSVGRGAALDLGISPMPTGRLHPDEVQIMKDFGQWHRATFSTNLARTATIKSKHQRKGKKYAPKHLIDGNAQTYWAVPDDILMPEVSLRWSKSQTFDVISIQEFIPLGQRIESLEVKALIGGTFKTIAETTSIGAKRLIKLDKPISTKHIKIKVTNSPVCPVISEIGLYLSK
jgi:alpha-L-fucosidase